jgi:hypothetical protein
MQCNNDLDCRIMFDGGASNGCLGLWIFGCGDQLKFWYKNGVAPVWSSIEVDGTDDNARSLMTQEHVGEAVRVSSSLGASVGGTASREADVEEGTSISLRGAKGSIKFL